MLGLESLLTSTHSLYTTPHLASKSEDGAPDIKKLATSVVNDTFTVSLVCHSCNLWPNSNFSATSTNQGFIWATHWTQDIESNDMGHSIRFHPRMGNNLPYSLSSKLRLLQNRCGTDEHVGSAVFWTVAPSILSKSFLQRREPRDKAPSRAYPFTHRLENTWHIAFDSIHVAFPRGNSCDSCGSFQKFYISLDCPSYRSLYGVSRCRNRCMESCFGARGKNLGIPRYGSAEKSRLLF